MKSPFDKKSGVEGWRCRCLRNPEGWVFRAKKFFAMHRFTEAEKLDVAALSFEGEALAWFQWEDRHRRMRN